VREDDDEDRTPDGGDAERREREERCTVWRDTCEEVPADDEAERFGSLESHRERRILEDVAVAGEAVEVAGDDRIVAVGWEDADADADAEEEESARRRWCEKRGRLNMTASSTSGCEEYAESLGLRLSANAPAPFLRRCSASFSRASRSKPSSECVALSAARSRAVSSEVDMSPLAFLSTRPPCV
jgi:hypothetical protein